MTLFKEIYMKPGYPGIRPGYKILKEITPDGNNNELNIFI